MRNQSNPNVTITDNGLVVKNIDRIEQIQSRMESRIEAKISSWQISRLIRRDFQIMSSKIYKVCCSKSGRNIVRELLLEVTLQAEEVRAKSFIYDDLGEPNVTELGLRIVSAETALLFQALKLADEGYVRINWAHKQGLITERTRDETAAGFVRAYSDMKIFIFGSKKADKTASQIGEEMGLG